MASMMTTTTTEAPIMDKETVMTAGAASSSVDSGHYWDGNPGRRAHLGEEARNPAFGGEFQPGLYRSVESRKFANPAPLGSSCQHIF